MSLLYLIGKGKFILLSLCLFIVFFVFCSKIGKLTLARLLTARDALMSPDQYVHSEEVLKLYSDLMKLDPTHSRYYKDEYSLILLQQVISSFFKDYCL